MNRPCTSCGKEALPGDCPGCGLLFCRDCGETHVIPEIVKLVRDATGVELPTTCVFCDSPAPVEAVIDLAQKLAATGALELLCCPSRTCSAELVTAVASAAVPYVRSLPGTGAASPVQKDKE